MIDTIRVAVMCRILGKGRCRLLRIVIISKRYAAATHAKLARLALRNFLSILIEYQCLRIHKRLADRKRLSLRLLACAHISGTDKRLCRSVQVRIYDIRQILRPVIKLFAWKHLTCKHGVLQIFWFYRIKCLECRNDSHCRRHPEECGNPFLIHILDQFDRERKQLLWDDYHLRTEIKRTIDIMHRYIEIKRCLIAEYIIRIITKFFVKPVQIIHNYLLSNQHALRHASGTACEKHIQRVHDRKCFPRTDGICLCIAYLLRIFEHDNLRTCCKAFRLFLMCQIGKHNLRLQHPHDRRDSFYRHLTVEWAVKITAVKCSKKACNTVNIFIHKNSDRVSHGLHFFCQHIAYFSGKSADLCISINLFAIFKRFLFRMKLRIPLQIFQYTLYHCFLLLLFFHYFLCFSITAMIASTESKFSGTTSLTGISTPIS